MYRGKLQREREARKENIIQKIFIKKYHNIKIIIFFSNQWERNREKKNEKQRKLKHGKPIYIYMCMYNNNMIFFQFF